MIQQPLNFTVYSIVPPCVPLMRTRTTRPSCQVEKMSDGGAHAIASHVAAAGTMMHHVMLLLLMMMG
jgi:hypothetical protein